MMKNALASALDASREFGSAGLTRGYDPSHERQATNPDESCETFLAEAGRALARATLIENSIAALERHFARHSEGFARFLAFQNAAHDRLSSTPVDIRIHEWLSDNEDLIVESYRQVDLGIAAFNTKAARHAATASDLSIIDIVIWHIDHGGLKFEPASLLAIIDGFRSIKPVSTRALCQIPFLLRLVLLEHLHVFLQHLAGAEHDLRAGTSDHAGDGHAESVLPLGRKNEEDLIFERRTRQIENIVTTLRTIATTDWAAWVGNATVIDRILGQRRDFHLLDDETRLRYRQVLEDLSLRLDLPEEVTTRKALEFAQSAERDGDAAADIAHFLIGKRHFELARALGLKSRGWIARAGFAGRWAWLAIPAGVAVLTAAALAVLGMVVPNDLMPRVSWLLMLALAALPASEGAFALISGAISMLVGPQMLPGYDYSGKIPDDARTLVVIPSLLIDHDNVDDLVDSLELHYLANRASNVHLALLTDWADSANPQADRDRDILDYARARIDLLSRKYAAEGGSQFLLLHRKRIFNPSEGAWMGWERKRGKLRELNRLLRNLPGTSFLAGYDAVPEDIRYVVTLDSDTRTTPGSIVRLIGKMHHPLNRPVIDPATGHITAGHAILQPRVSSSFGRVRKVSLFQKLYSAGRGLDPYVFTVSDIYQDLAGAGTFTGKGIYDVDAFESALGKSIRENTILSHDLLEGDLARSAFVSDVEFVEDFPLQYQVDFSRHQRWIRGDWQLLSWLVLPGNGLTLLGRWKIFDNLRRSLVPVGWIGACIAAWPFLGNWSAILLCLCLSLFMFAGPLISLLRVLTNGKGEFSTASYLRNLARETGATLAFASLRLIFLAHAASGSIDAISRALYRSVISGKKMLEWRSFAESSSQHSDRLPPSFRSMWPAPAFAATLPAVAPIAGHGLPLSVYPLLGLWAMSPVIAWFTGLSRNEDGPGVLQSDHRQELAVIGRRTWRYFSEFVTARTNFLPPDNFQDQPRGILAERTSPTNIGVYLLATLAAHEFGWIGKRETLLRLGDTLSTIEKLPKHRGHLFNWYRTDTLEPLSPRYVSSVDSGNLAGHLVTLGAACQMIAKRGIDRSGRFEGLTHTIALIRQLLKKDEVSVRPGTAGLPALIARLSLVLDHSAGKQEPSKIGRLVAIATKIDGVASRQYKFDPSSDGAEIRSWTKVLRETCLDIRREHLASVDEWAGWQASFAEIGLRARKLAMAMDFAFLERVDRQLMSIGYNVDSGRLDEPCYDLLASEARLASFLAIAKGDLPVSHWQKLGRPTTQIGWDAALLSWSGSMFEYLMPALVMREPKESMLGRTAAKAIQAHVEYGRSIGIPWGISEAAYNHRDANDIYRYSGFGAPSLGLKRGLNKDFVIAPYASLLASQIRREDAAANLRSLAKLGALGSYGYYEAVDFTPGRTGANAAPAIVRTYMAHHQGMSIAAIANTLLDGRLKDWFHSDPMVRSVELLLHERSPRLAPARAVRGHSGESQPIPLIREAGNSGTALSSGNPSGSLAGGRNIAARPMQAKERYLPAGPDIPADAEAAE